MYRHTQIGWGIIIVLGLFILFISLPIHNDKDILSANVILLLAIIMFSKLTITIDKEYIRLVFGLIGFPHRKFKLAKIESCHTDKKRSFAIVLGIHYGFKESLYNVSGPHAVVMVMKNGRKVYIGTDEPEKLREAIEERLA